MMKIKTILMCLAAVLAGVKVSAQVAEMEVFPQGKALAKTYEPQFIGSDGQQTIFVQMAGRSKKKMELVSYDMEQKELVRVLVSDDKEVKCYGGYINGDYVDLLMAEWKDNDMRVYRDRRNAKTLQVAMEPQSLADYKGTKGDKMGFTLTVSPNQQLLAGIYIISRENQAAEVQVSLYNRELDEYWKMDSRCRRLDYMYVTDSGEVILGGYKNGTYTFYVLDGENENEYSFDYSAKMSEYKVARYANGKLYIVYAHSGKESDNWMGTQVDYIGSICYDTKHNMVSDDRHDITPLEYNRMNNIKDEAKVKKNDCRVFYMNLVQSIEDKNGYYAMFDQMWRVSVNGVPSEFHRNGMMVLRVDNNGKFEWVKTFRIWNTSTWEARSQGDYRWIRTEKGPLLVWAECKMKQDLPENKPIKEYRQINSAGMLTAMLIDSKGDMERQHFALNAKQTLIGMPHRMETGDLLLIIRGTSRGYFAKMELK